MWSLKQVLLSNSDEVRDSTLDTYPSRYGFQNYCLVGAAVGTARSMLEYVFPETFWLGRPPASGNLCAQHAFGAPLRFSCPCFTQQRETATEGGLRGSRCTAVFTFSCSRHAWPAPSHPQCITGFCPNLVYGKTETAIVL